MGLGGKPRRDFAPHEIEQLKTFGGIRLPLEYIAAAFGMSLETLQRALKKNAAARDALDQGRSTASQNVRGTLYTLANGVKNPDGKTYRIPPSERMLEFWCKTQEGFRSADRIELTGKDGGPIETAEISREERLQRIEELNRKLALTEDEDEG